MNDWPQGLGIVCCMKATGKSEVCSLNVGVWSSAFYPSLDVYSKGLCRQTSTVYGTMDVPL